MRNDLPVTVIGGYLGAGKTTLINSLLRQASAAGTRVAVLVNDFGDIAIDADLIESQTDNMLQLAGGCICCTIGSDLLSALMALPDRAQRPDHVLIETSGVALPGTVAATVGLASGMRRDGVVVIADARNLATQRRDKYIADTIERQLAAANLIVVSKTDRADADAIALRDQLTAEYPATRVLLSEFGDLPIDTVLGSFAPVQTAHARPFQPGTNSARQFTSLSFQADRPVDVPGLTALLCAAANGVVRAKGFVHGNDGQRYVLHVVAEQCDLHPTENTAAPDQLVLIGLRQNFNTDSLTQALSDLGLTQKQ